MGHLRVVGEEGGAVHAGGDSGSMATAITFQMCDALQTRKVNVGGGWGIDQ